MILQRFYEEMKTSEDFLEPPRTSQDFLGLPTWLHLESADVYHDYVIAIDLQIAGR